MALEKEAHVLSGELQLKSFGQFIEHYDNQLAKLGLIATFAHCCTDNILQITKNQYAPITINYDAGSERVSVFPLIDSDDHNLNKVLIVFAKLCEDVQELDKESHKYQYRLFFFDEELMEVEENGNAQLYLLKISQMLDFLFECKYFLQRCLLICSNLFQQLVALLDEDVLGCKNVLPINFNTLVDHFVLLLQQFAIFDEIITSSSVLKHWSFFKKSIHFANQNASAFSKYSENDLCGLENVVNDLEIMFMGHLFQNVIDIIGNIKEQTKPKIIGVLAGLFQNYIKSQLAEICKYDSDLSDLTQTPNVIRINLLCVCYHKVFGSLETKSLKQLIECNNKHCSITLIGNIIWCPEAFIFKHAETLVKSCDRYCNNANNVRRIYLHNRMQSLPKVVYDYCVQVVDWISKLNAFSISSDINLEELRSRCLHILKGTKLAGQINHLIKSVTNLHVLLKISVPKSGLHLIAKLIELLKLTHNAFVENSDIISETINYSIQHLQYQALFLIASAKKKIGKDVMSIEKNLSTISALQIAEKLLYGPATTKRLLVVRLALSTSDSAQLFSGDHLVKFLKIMRRLEILGEQQKNVEFVCDTSFMYWHQSIYGIAIKNIFDQHCMVTQIARITHSAIDHYQALGASSASQFLPIIQFTKAINQTLNEEIIVKICQRIETQLRLDFHIGNLQLDVNNPFTTKREDFRELVHLNPLCIIGRHIAIKDHIEHYLSNMFYNLTTVSLHDWRTYGIMRQLASNKFNLTTVEDHLPTQTLEQGLDVLEIMRNINVFVAKYMYNLNNQIFIERSSNNKHLNTINIRHIANSLRTHGTGIINTTVNYTYQFLRKKFYIFSQFMYDEHIKSRLMKDLKYFRDNKDHLNQMYDFERADNFNKLIRQLGISPNGESYMDLFRQLISQIGNAMGYIRMMRSGAINSCSNASIYLPVLDEQLGFSNRVSESSLLEEALHAAVNLESSYHNLTQEMTESSHYFKLMIDAFAPFFQNADNIHLRNFFLIIPPLTINYVEYIQTSKDKMTKKNKDGALFTDDGFAIGLAFILKLLNQTNDFNSLHWFKSINNKFKKERDALKKEITNISSTTDGKLQQTAHLTEKRITRIQMEFDLLFFNLGSAKIFFQ